MGINGQWVNLIGYRKRRWEGTFEEYLEIDEMILSHGIEEFYENKEKVIRYKFFAYFTQPTEQKPLRDWFSPSVRLVKTAPFLASGHTTCLRRA